VLLLPLSRSAGAAHLGLVIRLTKPGFGVCGDAHTLTLASKLLCTSLVGPELNIGLGATATRHSLIAQLLVPGVLALATVNGVAQTGGAVAGFRWALQPAGLDADRPIPVTVTAVDALGQTTTNFAGKVHFSAIVGSQRISSFVISEICLDALDFVECANATGKELDAGGWMLVFYDVTTWPAPTVQFKFPSNTPVPPGGVFVVTESDEPGDTYPWYALGRNLQWGQERSSPQGPLAAALLLDPDGRLHDAVFLGKADPREITQPVVIRDGDWNGEPLFPRQGLNLPGFHHRIGWRNSRRPEDWLRYAPSATPGLIHPYLRLPLADSRALAMQPFESGSFQGGVWSGELRVTEPAAPLILRADDEAGHSGVSEAIRFPLPGDLAVTLTAHPANFPWDASDAHYLARVRNTGPVIVTNVVLDVSPFLLGASQGGIRDVWASQGAVHLLPAIPNGITGTAQARFGDLGPGAEASLAIRLSEGLGGAGLVVRRAAAYHDSRDPGYDNDVVVLEHEIARPSLPLRTRPTHWWRGENDPADSAGTNRLELIGGATYTTGRVGRAFRFPGGQPAAAVATATPSLNVAHGDSFAFEAWLRLPTTAPDGTFILVSKETETVRDGRTERVGWAISLRDGRFGARVSDDDPATPAVELMDSHMPGDARDNAWHHVSLVRMPFESTWYISLRVDKDWATDPAPDQELGSLTNPSPLRFGVPDAAMTLDVDEPAYYTECDWNNLSVDLAHIYESGPFGKQHNLLLLRGAGGLVQAGTAGRPLRIRLYLWYRGPDPVEAAFSGSVDGPRVISARVSKGWIELNSASPQEFKGEFGELSIESVETIEVTVLATNAMSSGQLVLRMTPPMVGQGVVANIPLIFVPDTDGDGMPDWWELGNGLDPAAPHDGAADADGDRVSNLAEYDSGTLPLDASSLPQFWLERILPPYWFFAAESTWDRLYSLERSSSLGPEAHWTETGGAGAMGNGRVLGFMDVPPSEGNVFYRLRVQPLR